MTSGETDFVYRRISRLDVFVYVGAVNYDDSHPEFKERATEIVLINRTVD